MLMVESGPGQASTATGVRDRSCGLGLEGWELWLCLLGRWDYRRGEDACLRVAGSGALGQRDRVVLAPAPQRVHSPPSRNQGLSRPCCVFDLELAPRGLWVDERSGRELTTV